MQAVQEQLNVPRRNVTLADGIFRTAFEANRRYLQQYNSDDLLFWFRKRSGQTDPPGRSWGWDSGGPDMVGWQGAISR